MLSFFEMLNGCSPMRATAYMGFTLIAMFLTYVFLEGMIDKIFSKKETKKEETEE